MINKKKALGLLILFFCISICFFSMPDVSLVQASDTATQSGDGGLFGSVFKGIKGAIVWLLYYVIFVPITWIASGAIALFGFAANPDMLSGSTGILNRAVVYELWKFIRDFFNLFFIFSLLLVAFSTVFQIEKYSIKKMLLSIVLAALFVNFSFPISRFLIDTANVPMYFFAKQMMSATGKSSSSDALAASALSSTRIEQILLPVRDANDKTKADLDAVSPSKLFLAIVFMFLFSISLAVLAIMFVIRLTALVVLVIFSPIGFVAAAIPIDALKKFSGQWWDNFNKYLIFGPVAMLMLLVTVRFMSAISEDSWYKQAQNVATNTAGSGTDATAIAQQIILFSIPMIMIWMTIGISGKIGVAGAGAVEGWGKKVRGWGQKAAMGTMVAPFYNARTRGLATGLKERAEKTRGVKLLTPKYWGDKSKDTEAAYKGLGKGGREGMANAKLGLQNKKIYEAAEENKKNNVSNSGLLNDLKSGSDVAKAAAAITLADRKAISSPEQLQQAVTALKDNTREISKVMESARGDALEFNNPQEISALLNSPAFAKKGSDGKPVQGADGRYELDEKSDMYKDFKSKMKKEGQIKMFADYRIATEIEKESVNGPADQRKIRNDVYNDTIGKLSVDDLAKQGSVHSSLADDAGLREYMKEYVDKHKGNYQKTMEKMSASDQDKWTSAGVTPDSVPEDTSGGAKEKEAARQENLRKMREAGQRSR